MSQPRSVKRSLLPALTVLVIAMTGAISATAHAQSFGEIGKPFGKSGKGNGAFTLPSGNSVHALGVDTSDGNSVYVADEPKPENNKGETEFRIQKFSATGEFLASGSFIVTTPAGENGGETLAVEGIAVDPTAPGGGRVYALVVTEREETTGGTAKIDGGEPAAGTLYAFSTKAEAGKLVPAKNEKGEPFAGAVFASKDLLETNSDVTGNPAQSALLEPSGIAVDPTTHDVIIVGFEDQGAEELLVAAQRVSDTGTLGARWVDKHECFEGEGEGEGAPPCFVENEETFQPGSPMSPVVTQSGRLLVDVQGSAIWEIPKGFGADEAPLPVVRFGEATPLQALLTFPGNPTPSEGGSLTFAHEPSEAAGEGRLYQSSLLEASPKNRYPAVLAFKLAEGGGSLNATELGWTGGQNKVQHEACALSGFSQPVIGAGTGEKIFALDPNVPAGKVQEAPNPHVVVFGPGGQNCLEDSAAAPKATSKGATVGTTENPAPIGQKVVLSSAVTGANALSVEWNFGDGSAPVTVSAYQYQTTSVEHAFATIGKETVKETIHTDDLAKPTLVEEASFTVAAVNPVAQFSQSPTTVGVPVKFTSTSPSPDENKSALVKYVWSFGDGAKTTTTTPVAVEHTYAEAKKYTVSLEVADALGHSGSTSHEITVAAAGGGGGGSGEGGGGGGGGTTTTTTTTTPPSGGGSVLGATTAKGNPAATLAGTALAVSSAGSFPVKVSCPAGESSCSGTITLKTLGAVSASAKKSVLTLASGSFTVAGGASKTVTLHLSTKARALLKRSHMLKARATVAAHDPTGASHTTLVTVTLKLAKKSAHH
jgi:hypothetical protein